MKTWKRVVPFLVGILLTTMAASPLRRAGENPSAPTETVKLIFIHHSTGQNWLADGNGNLGQTLAANNYFVSDTNYDWGPDSIGSRTDIPHWTEWFASADTPTYMDALFNESGQHSSYTRLDTDPGGQNEIIMFKSCFPNSNLEGNPNDPPSASGWLTVGHAKYVYNQILTYFGAHPEKLFVVITAPPLRDGTHAANARAFNQWLMNDWLSENGYTGRNVAIFDFYNVLTDVNAHHWYHDGVIEDVVVAGRNTLAYPTGDDHPSAAGGQKATAEFVPLLNIFYNRWKENVPVMPGAGTYDDRDGHWIFSNGWASYNGAGPFGRTSRYTNGVNSQTQFTFTGNRFTFTYTKASNRGLIDVYLDGARISQINARSSTTAWQQTWTSPIFAMGEHTVRFVHAGGGTYIDVDAIQIFEPSDLIAPAAVTDLDASTGATTGTVDLSWTAPGDDAGVGTAASYLVRYSPSAITSDNWDAATPVTTGIPTPVAAGDPQTMTVSGLTPGVTYFFAVRAQDEEGNLAGVSNSLSAAAQVQIPAAAGIYDDTDVNWLYTGSWAQYNCSGPVDNTLHYASTVGSEAQFTFNGVKFKLTYFKASSRGLIDVYVDGSKIAQINAYSSSKVWRASWTSPTFTPGIHTVRFVHAGGRAYIDVDAIQVFDPPPTVPAGSYDDNHAAWVFSSGWMTYTGAGPANNSDHYTNVVGSEAQLTFTGTGFTFTYVKASNRGSIDVYVDGTKVTQIYARSSSTAWLQTWTLDTLSSGTHTVRFVNAGGGYIDVDTITILP